MEINNNDFKLKRDNLMNYEITFIMMTNPASVRG